MKVMWKGRKRREEGFTLLEVMVALAIISASLVVLLYAQNANIGRSHYADSLATAALLAQKVISESGVDALSEGRWDGKEEKGNMIFSWEKSVEPSLVEGLKKVSVVITWGDGKTYKLETYRAG